VPVTPDIATVLGTAGGTVVVAFAALTVVGVVLLSRRARRNARAPLPGRTDAGVALVRADDAVRAAADDLAFAVAQFGEERTRDFARALQNARTDLDRAFALQQRLDDDEPEGENRRKGWAKSIRALADRARETVQSEAARFADLRRSEASAPETLKLIRTQLAGVEERTSTAKKILAELRASYVESAVAPVADNIEAAASAVAAARAAADEADAAIAGSRVTAVSDALAAAQQRGREAATLLDAIEHRRDELAAAVAEIATLAAEQQQALEQARSLRDAPPDPDSSAAVNAAIAALEGELAAIGGSGRRDPVAELDRLVDADDALDVAVSAARNQQRRLDGARGALTGALVSARAQISSVEDFIGSRGGGASSRTKLAEAKRELVIAENESDPVAALDAARRAQNRARDADDLARYAGAGSD
jgi:DNA repair exonuclease SbcCD ATPase subunit